MLMRLALAAASVFCACAGLRAQSAAASPARAQEIAPLDDYRGRVRKAAGVIDDYFWLFATEETANLSAGERAAELRARADEVRGLLPPAERVAWAGRVTEVNNAWLHRELEGVERQSFASREERAEAVVSLIARLRALAARLDEAAAAQGVGARDKEAEKGRLGAILRRPEYNEEAARGGALQTLLAWIVDLLRRLLPESRPLSPGAAGFFTGLARLLVYLLIIGALGYVLWRYLPGYLQRRARRGRKEKREPRVILGERLAPDQSAADLLAEAEGLARAGELRGAIRKAYVAVLVELGERKILRLAQHKTNRDYLQALRRERAQLYELMRPLTQSFERHWYGLAPAGEDDWRDFRARCRAALRA